ncbi:MAG TPA: hypothetical protein VND70_04310 [Acidimicrobiales bacterium]|nr:hypothetical protein [Acidimicrobiales bacterium]
MFDAGQRNADSATLGHRNLIAYSRALTRWGSRGDLHEADGVLAYAGGSPIPVVGNGAFRAAETVSPATLIGVADNFFARHRRGYSIKVRDTGQDDDLRQACEENGFATFGEPVPEMICEHALKVPPLPEGVRMQRVGDVAGISDFAAVNADAYSTYSMPADVLGDLFDQPENVLADPDTTIVVAYRGTQPLAAALTYVSDGIASLQWVGSINEARRLNLGRAVTVWATNVAFELGAASCTLQASPMGAPLYTALGYETLYRYRDHVRWTAPRG